MSTLKDNKPGPKPRPNIDPRDHTTVYLPESLRIRLMECMIRRYPGQMNRRSQLIAELLDEALRKEGY